MQNGHVEPDKLFVYFIPVVTETTNSIKRLKKMTVIMVVWTLQRAL